MRISLFAGVAAAALVMPVSAYAQQITTGIEGTVADETGAPIEGASVVITDTRTGSVRTISTGSGGSFSADGLVTGGPYTIAANADGYEGQTIEGVNTSLQGNTSLTFNLTTGAGEIVVTAQRVKLAQLAVGPGQSFGAEVLATAPSFNRDVRDIIRIDPRVSLDRDDGGSGQDRISCLGGNDRGNTFTVDGIPQSDIYGLNDTGFSSRSSTPLPYDAVRETQVQFAPFDVDYGQFTGCAINVVTKSGTNKYHGGGFFEYSNSDLRAKTVAGGRPVAAINPEKRWGVSFGGPVIKDMLFLYGAYEHQEAGQSQDDGPAGAGYANPQAGITLAQFNEISQVLHDVYGVDTGPLVHNRDYTNDRYFARADWQITEGQRLEVTYQRLEEGTIKPDDLFTGNSPQAVGANTFLVSGTISNYYSGRLYSQWSDNFSTEVRYARSEIVDRQDPVGGGEAQSDHPIPRIIVGIDNPSNSATAPNTSTIDGAVLGGPGTSRSANDLQTQIQQYRLVGNLTLGDHKIKFGGELNTANLFNLFVQNATGTLVFRNLADLRQGLLSPGLGNNQTSTTPSNVIGGQTEGAFGNFTSDGNINSAAARFKRSIYSAFVQDEWRMTEQLKAVVGVRLDWYDGGRPEFNPVFQRRYGITNATSFSNIPVVVLPRVALTYDFGDSSLFRGAQLRGGVGIFSGGDPLVWFGNVFQNDGSAFALGTTQAAGCPTGQIDVVVNGTFTGVPTCMRASAQATAAAGQGNTQAIDPDIKMTTVFRANLGFQTELNLAETGFFSGWNVNLNYIYSKYKNPFTLVDVSQAIDTRKGLNGRTIDGRPIYSTIDLLAAGCNGHLQDVGPAPDFTGLTSQCFTGTRGGELVLTNSAGYRSHVASLLLSKRFEGGLLTSGGSTYMTFGYAFTDSHDRRNMYNSTAGSNYGQTAAFDRQNPEETTGFYQSRHNITFSTNFRNEFVDDYGTALGITFVARAGRPYSLTFTGNNVFNPTNGGLTTNDAALFYVPTGPNDPKVVFVDTLSSSNAVVRTAAQNAADVDAFISGVPCADKARGTTIKRNTCQNDWYYDMDLTLSQELPGPGRLFGVQDKIKVYAMFDNFLNFLDSNWNVQRRRNFFGVQDVAQAGRAAVVVNNVTVNAALPGVDSQGRYVISAYNGNTFADDNAINISSSVWRVKFGISYDF